MNRGCIPTKAYYNDARFIASLAKSDQYGVTLSGWQFNLAQARENKQKIVNTLVAGLSACCSPAALRQSMVRPASWTATP